jgi:hypothetical protein
MYQDKVILCASSAYDQKYFLNEDFKSLPENKYDILMPFSYDGDLFKVFTVAHS